MHISDLTKLGLTDAESKIYHSVLRLGTCTVKAITKDCGFHRTNIYDVLDQLKEKGLVSFFKEGKVMKYQVTDPHNLHEFLKEKQDFLNTIFPELEKLHKFSSDEVQVEVLKGEEGMKNLFRDILRVNKSLYMFGVKGQFREHMPVFAQQWYRDAKKQKLKAYGIYTEKNPPPDFISVRYIDKKYSTPVATFIYGDKINVNIWEPSLVAITITSKLVAHMYKQHFDLLWKMAKK